MLFKRPAILMTTLVGSALLLALTLGACSESSAEKDSTGSSSSSSSPSGAGATATEVRLGYFPNVTHAPALVGLAEDTFKEQLGDTKLVASAFNAGPEATEALFAEALDITYIGPNPSINAFAQSNGEAVRIVSGSTSGGVSFVVQPEISSPNDLKGKKVASPQLGGTQDVALRVWLKDQGLETTTSGGGDVSITPLANADTLTAFRDGQIAGAWVPEPWASRLIAEAGGKVLVNEADLWPDGRYVTTQVLVRTEFLDKYPGTVRAILQGHLDALALIESDPAKAQADTNDQIEAVTQKRLPESVIASAWKNLTFTADPIATSLKKSAEDAESVDLLDEVNLKGIYSLELLNSLLTSENKTGVDGL